MLLLDVSTPYCLLIKKLLKDSIYNNFNKNVCDTTHHKVW